jgi:hypothetical protein
MPFKPLSSSNSDMANYGQINDMLRELYSRDQLQIFKDDSGTRRVLLGRGANGFYGLKVSKEGFDVFTAADDELVFNSNQNVFKVVGQGTVEVTSSGVAATNYTIAHNLGFSPTVVAFLNSVDIGGLANNIDIPLPTWLDISVNGDLAGNVVFGAWIDHAVDDTNYYIKIYNGTGVATDTYPVKYYLLQETAN